LPKMPLLQGCKTARMQEPYEQGAPSSIKVFLLDRENFPAPHCHLKGHAHDWSNELVAAC
jgi:hypothetical protein